MLTLSGISGEGTVYGTFPILRQGATGRGTDFSKVLSAETTPSDWYLPKPDGIWWDVNASPYGPRLSHIKVGFLDGVENSPHSFNDCSHGTVSGDGFYRGDDGRLGVLWLRRRSDDTGYTTCSPRGLPLPSGKPLLAYNGYYSTERYPYGGSVYDRYGNLVNIGGWKTAELESTCYGYHNLFPAFAGSSIRETLLPHDQWYTPDAWYCISNSQYPVRDYKNNVHFAKTSWSRPSRTVWQHEEYQEFHSTASYTPATSIGYSGLGYTVDALYRTTKCTLTHIRSTKPGYFEVKCNYETKVSNKGYAFPSEFEYHYVRNTYGYVTRLFVLGPGLVPKADEVDLDRVMSSLDMYVTRTFRPAMKLPSFDDFRYVNTKALLARDGLESNWIENLSSVGGPGEVLAPLVEGYRAVKSGNVQAARKALAAAYLVYKYVVRPNIADAKDVKENLANTIERTIAPSQPRDRRRYRSLDEDVPFDGSLADVIVSTEYWHQVKDNKLSRIWNGLEQLGLEPSLANGWDLVPYSFVADWFLPLGDILDVISGWFNCIITRELIARISSVKVVWPLTEDILDSVVNKRICTGASPIKGVAYRRSVYHDYGPLEFLGQSFNFDGLSVSQMIQGGALITQIV